MDRQPRVHLLRQLGGGGLLGVREAQEPGDVEVGQGVQLLSLHLQVYANIQKDRDKRQF